MPELDRRLLIAIPIILVVIFATGFALGRVTTRSAVSASETTTTIVTTAQSQNDAGNPTTEGGDTATDITAITGDPTVVLPPSSTDPGDIPQYGTDEDREALIAGLVEAGVAGGSGTGILATADYVCYTLERLQAQKRSLSFTVRVVWNESLAELPPEDLTAFGTVLAAAPSYLCPQYADFGERVSYWLGY